MNMLLIRRCETDRLRLFIQHTSDSKTPRAVSITLIHEVHSMKQPTTKTIPALLILAVSILLTACNTVEGVGKDIQSGGKAIERAAQ